MIENARVAQWQRISFPESTCQESSSTYPMGFRNPSQLHIYIGIGNIDLIKLAIKNGHDINARALGYGYTPLMFAVQNGYGDIVKLLVESGADINIKTTQRDLTGFYKSALSEAARFNFPMIAAFLLSKGADPSDLNRPEFPCHYKALISCLEFGIRLWDPTSCSDYHEPTDPVLEILPTGQALIGAVGQDDTNPDPEHLE